MVRNVTDCAGAKKLETELKTRKIAEICETLWTKTSIRISTARMRSLAIIRRFTFQWSTKRTVMRLMTANSAKKSPNTLTNCASQSARNGLYFKIVFAVNVGDAAAGEVI